MVRRNSHEKLQLLLPGLKCLILGVSKGTLLVSLGFLEDWHHSLCILLWTVWKDMKMLPLAWGAPTLKGIRKYRCLHEQLLPWSLCVPLPRLAFFSTFSLSDVWLFMLVVDCVPPSSSRGAGGGLCLLSFPTSCTGSKLMMSTLSILSYTPSHFTSITHWDSHKAVSSVLF